MPSLKNPQTVAFGSNAVTDVLEIAWSQDAAEIVGPVADAEVYPTIAEHGSVMTRGTITFRNPVQAAAAITYGSVAGGVTMTAALKGAGEGGADKTLTIANVSIKGSANDVGHDRTANATVSFIAAAEAGGATNPVALT